MSLGYNIDFAVAGVLISIVLLVYSFSTRGTTSSDKRFRWIVVCSLMANSLDALTTVTIAYQKFVPLGINYLLNSLLFLSESMIFYFFVSYVGKFVEEERGQSLKGQVHLLYLIVLYVMVLIVNVSQGMIFSITDEAGYQHGILYFVVMILPVYYACFTLYLFFRYKGMLKRDHWITIVVFYIAVLIGTVIQMLILPQYLLLTFATSIGLIPVYVTMETPDYRALVEANKQLEKEKAKANSANEAKTDFLANMSHEIRTPINAVLGMNEMILRESKDNSINYYSGKIKSAGQTLLSLINDILDISKVEAGKMELYESEYELKQLINDSFDMVNEAMQEKGLKFELEVSNDLPSTLFGDEVHIRQILVNILNNAVKYTKRGYIRMKVIGEMKDDMINISFAIKDTGIGIKREEQKEIFEKFSRAELEKNINIAGTGLGLNLSINLAHLMNGDISVKSLYRVGTMFTFTVPQVIKNRNPIGNVDVGTVVAGEGSNYKNKIYAPTAKILVVDDVENNLSVIKLLLKQTGIQVDTALSGARGIDLCMKTKYDVILMDHMMPEMNGIDTLKSMQMIPNFLNADTPVIMLTANAVTGVREQYLREGFVDYLSKPVKGSLLEDTLIKYISKEKQE